MTFHVCSDGVEKLLTVTFKLGFTDAGDLEQLVLGGREAAGHLMERFVRENHIRRDALL